MTSFNNEQGNNSYIGAIGQHDQINYEGALSDYTITKAADGTLTISHPEFGTDTASNIDGFWFGGEQKWYNIEDVFSDAGNDAGAGVDVGGVQTYQGTAGIEDMFDGQATGEADYFGGGSEYDQINYEGSASDYTFESQADGSVHIYKADGGYDIAKDIDGFWFQGEQKWYAMDDVLDDGHGGGHDPHVDPAPAKASIVGATSIDEGTTSSYKVQLDRAVDEDTWVDINVMDMGTNFQSGDTAGIDDQYVIWNAGEWIDRGPYDNVRTSYFNSTDRVAATNVSDDNSPSWDYSTFKDGQAVGTTIKVLVKAGETMSDSFDIKAWQELLFHAQPWKVSAPTEGWEPDEFVNLQITNITGDAVSSGEDLKVQINDTSTVLQLSPVALDMNGDGEIGVTGETSSHQKDAGAELGRTVEFDLDGDGDLDTIEWFDGSGDGILVDSTKVGPNGEIDGNALFGDQGGQFANGYEKLAAHDVNGDGEISGDELVDLSLWMDDGDAVLEEGEMVSVTEAGIVSISTEMEITYDSEGRELMQSSATDVDGNEILTEDVWFAEADAKDVYAEVPDYVKSDADVIADTFDADMYDMAM